MSKAHEDWPAEIHWEGDSRDVLAGFPQAVRADFGFSLWQLQNGKSPGSSARRMESLGPGVWELKEHDEKTWYRVLYLSKIGNVIHVLHCFEKQSRKTGRRDLDVARKRLAQIRKRMAEKKAEQRNDRQNK